MIENHGKFIVFLIIKCSVTCKLSVFLLICSFFTGKASADEVLGCGGFIKSDVPIDYAKVEVRLVTKQGIIKDRTNCAPNNGYYFLPLYDRGEFLLELSPPPGWSFTPKEVQLKVDGTDACSLGKDINFVFDGFGVTGKVDSFGSYEGGPQGVTVILFNYGERRCETTQGGYFSFSPVYPGNYSLTISHPRWKIYKMALEVSVTDRNAVIPPNSLVILGYSVKGLVRTAEGYPVRDVVVALFSKNKGVQSVVENCDKNKPNVFKDNNFLCQVTSNEKGEYLFPVVSSGDYYVTLFFKERNIYFQPENVEFSVAHDDVELFQLFQIVGFSVTGRVLDGKNQPISNVKIILNSKEVTRSDKSGYYKLEKLTEGTYKIKAETDDLIYEETSMVINTNTQKLPDLKPSAYRVCGKVISDKPQTVVIKKIESTTHLLMETSENQKFCQFLQPGKYEVEVKISEEDRKNGLLFFPLTHVIEVKSESVLNLIFSQLKSEISGKVKCFFKNDCEQLNVIFKSGFEENVVPIKDSKYIASEMHPGIYDVTLGQNRFCWNSNTHTVNVNSAQTEVPEFSQTGYLVNFVSSHDVKVSYRTKEDKLNEISVIRGVTSVCLEAPGEYSFTLKSCHSFPSNTVTYDTASKNNQITLNADHHTSLVDFISDINQGPIRVEINYGNSKREETINYTQGKYKLELLLKPSEIAVITPLSDFLIFSPSSIEVEGTNDCKEVGDKITVSKGKVLTGKIQPPLEGVLIAVEGLPDGETLSSTTDSNGAYKFRPLDSKYMYTVTAEKDSYIITGPDNNGNFKAQKLAEIIVQVFDVDNTPLAGVLLSLSGASSYRKNLQTDQNGKISFHSLGAGDYFLRPMMKEYLFEPASKIINVEEGKTVNVELFGKRVAYSAFGRVTTLNDEPVRNINIVALGLNNCTTNQEEATADQSGNFRIRGLQPYCSFKISIHVTNKYDALVERTAPSFIEVQKVTEDVKDLHFTVFHPITMLDVIIRIYAENPDHYRSLRLKILNENDEYKQVYSTEIENHLKSTKDKSRGVLVYPPSMHVDGNSYVVYLEHAYLKNNNAPSSHFVANSSFKYIEMNYVVKTTRTEQHIKQTSIWFVVFFFVFLFAVFKSQYVLNFAKEHLNINQLVDSLSKYVPIPNKRKVERSYELDDIDQIVQDINNVRKRSKKTVS